MKFHRRCGDRVTLLNDNSTAVRNFVEFNHGLILSAEPLQDDVIFEVVIDRKVNVWNGSLEIGVTTLDPEYMELPATATKLKNTAWIWSGNSVLKDTVTVYNVYGPELDTIREGDCLGVMRTSKAELVFYINGRSLGVASRDMPARLFAVIDLYGQCVQVSISNAYSMRPIMECSLDRIEENPNNDEMTASVEMDVAGIPETSYSNVPHDLYIPMTLEGACALVAQDKLRFHTRCGLLIKLSANNKTAERVRPLDDYNNGVVMTHRPLYDNELFEIRIDRLVNKWSGSIEVGVSTHNPATIRFPSTMTNIDSGTIMMSGCKVLLNGHSTVIEYGNFNLDELREGDTVGMMRKSNGKLHYYINGVDQGVAADTVEPQVWGVVDLYGMTVKVTIVDPCEDIDSNNAPTIPGALDLPTTSGSRPRLDEESLLFHTLRDSNVIIINDGKTAHRPNAFEFFNNGIVMTHRTLKTNELFQVRLDLVIPKWAGSIEIGVTQHSSYDIQFPFKMCNAKSGTWAMTGEDVIRDGTIIIPQYVRNLNRLVEGDTVGVMLKDKGILHFYVNGVDQGPAAFHVPEYVYGIIDLYGRVAQATIVDNQGHLPPVPIDSPESPLSTESNATMYPEMCFHRVHGRNARLKRNRLTAMRDTIYSEFNDAVLFSSRPLRECEMFELRIDRMVDCWIGSLEIGVTAIRPEDLEVNGGVSAGTATDLNWDTYILSGAAIMKDGECVRSGYPLDLDTLTVGSRVGMMWHADRSLHFYLDGMDMGKAWYVPHLNIYAVVDLYGQCTEVTILRNEERTFNYNNGCSNSDNSLLTNSRTLETPPPPYWSFSEYCGENVCFLFDDYSGAQRYTPEPTDALVFSSSHLALDDIFEVRIAECKYNYAGSFRMGITDINILNVHVNRSLPPSISFLPHYTAYIDGKYMKQVRPGNRGQEIRTFTPSFEWLRTGDRIGFKKTSDGKVLVYYNSELLEDAFENVPDKVYVVVEIIGHVTQIHSLPRETKNHNAAAPITTDDFTKLQPVFDDNLKNIFTEYLMSGNALDSSEPSTSNVEVVELPAADEVTSNEVPQIEATKPNEETVAESSMTESGTLATVVTGETRKRRRPLPYTFHYVHGKNVKLCSSDTVAMRTSGYEDGVAVVSQPLRRGHNFRFRVDKVDREWSGSVSIGALGVLPSEPLPRSAIYLEPPVWVVSSELLYDNGTFVKTSMATDFDDLSEQSVLTIQFRLNSELVINIDRKAVGVIGTVPRTYSHVFPLIDLYGRVEQVSVLLHPHVITRGTSLDLPIITENLREETLAELGLEDEIDIKEIVDTLDYEVQQPKKNTKAYSEDHLIDDDFDPVIVVPSSSTHPDPSLPRDVPTENENIVKEIKCQKNSTNRTSLHHSLILTENSPLSMENELSIHKSHSTHSFCQVTDEHQTENVINSGNNIGMEARSDDIMIHEQFCDTNIQHNDRYPEANDVDSLDNEIMDALALETGNLPDLTEEQSSSIDESTRRDDLWTESLSIENLNYLNRILCLDQELSDGHSLESEWEASGEGCEHLHLVLKYWNFLVLPYPELRQAVSWGLVRCYCSNCHPDADPLFAGWVRIERIDGVGAARRAFWRVVRSTLSAAQVAAGGAGAAPAPARRPRSLAPAPSAHPPILDAWFDEEGKPHHTVLAIEIDVEGSEADNDRLLAFLIYLKPQVSCNEDNPPSLEE